MKARRLVTAARRARQIEGAPLPRRDNVIPSPSHLLPTASSKRGVPSQTTSGSHARQGAS